MRTAANYKPSPFRSSSVELSRSSTQISLLRTRCPYIHEWPKNEDQRWRIIILYNSNSLQTDAHKQGSMASCRLCAVITIKI